MNPNLTSYTHATTRLPPARYDRPPSAVFLRTRRYDPAPVTDSHQGARSSGASESHLSTTPPLTTADPSATATSAATTLVASSSPDATEGTADHFSAPAPPAADDDTTATAASTTATPAVPPPLHVSVGAKDGTPAASSSPNVALGTTDGVTAAAASTADTGLDVDTDHPVPVVTAPPRAEYISPFLLHIRQSTTGSY